jgi:acyl-CoA synthetase (AMP-forming)/AMP-acid ligase II
MSSNRPEWVVAVQAIWRLGAAVVLFSPAWKAAAVLVFSSGTTGLPKAVRHTHGSLRAAIGHWRDALELTERDRIQVTTPPSHILGVLNIATALELGIVSLRVVSLTTGTPVESGEIGEIQVRSESLMSGYLPAEETAESFSDGWYRTGDVGYVEPDGWLHLTDRSKEMIKVRGFQVDPAEVEGVLLGHAAVLDCAVFGVPDPVNGESIIAAVTLDTAVDPDALIAHVAARLASYKKPSEVLVVDEIPRLPSGKALRRMLKERYGRASVD